MDIALLVIFLITDWSIVGIFAAVYGGKHRYREGMIFGVHVPESAVLDKDTAALTAHYRKVNRNFYIINLAAGTGAAFLSLGHLSIFMIVWTLWLLAFCVVSMGLLFFAHRRMYSLKVSKKWIVGEPVRTVIVDTSVSSVSEKLPFSHWWHLPVILASILALFFLPHLREYFGDSYLRFLLPGAVLLMEAIFWFVHVWYSHRENVVYSNDSKINLAVNEACLVRDVDRLQLPYASLHGHSADSAGRTRFDNYTGILPLSGHSDHCDRIDYCLHPVAGK